MHEEIHWQEPLSTLTTKRFLYSKSFPFHPPTYCVLFHLLPPQAWPKTPVISLPILRVNSHLLFPESSFYFWSAAAVAASSPTKCVDPPLTVFCRVSRNTTSSTLKMVRFCMFPYLQPQRTLKWVTFSWLQPAAGTVPDAAISPASTAAVSSTKLSPTAAVCLFPTLPELSTPAD